MKLSVFVVSRALFLICLSAIGCSLLASLAGCDFYTSATVQTFDANAASARAVADSAAKGATPPPDMAYQLECFARTFQNLSDAGHWKAPTYTKAPTTQPTTLPWDNSK
jgi:hypothetical protein